MIYSLLFPKFKNIAPVKPAASGVNCDKGPKNAVKFVPIQDIAKSTTANPISSIPLLPKQTGICSEKIKDVYANNTDPQSTIWKCQNITSSC